MSNDLELIESINRSRVTKGFPPLAVAETTQEQLWEYDVATAGLTRELSLSDHREEMPEDCPWEHPKGADITAVAKHSGTTARVLIVSTHNLYPNNDAIVRWCTSMLGIERIEMIHVGTTADFWEKYFGTERFLTRGETRIIPNLIITTGALREYHCTSKGDWDGVDMRKLLKKIGAFWGIPVRLIEAEYGLGDDEIYRRLDDGKGL